MNCGLRMDDYTNLVWRQVEEAAGFDHLETFVHERGGVDGNAVTHFPGRMVERLLDGNVGEVRLGSVEKRAARGREPNTANFFPAASAKALMDSVVLAVDWQKRLPLSAGFGGNKFSRGH